MTPGTTIRLATPSDRESIRGLLAAADLDADGLEDPSTTFLLAEEDGRSAGTIALEIHGSAGLLRSAAVAPEFRGRGIGGRLSAALLEHARALRLREVVLLTTTAAPYFARLGFTAVPWSAVDPRVRTSAQFRGGCPSTAVCMRLTL